MTNLKREWRRVKLSDVALNSTVATKDHEADGFTRYIIGKHIPEHGGRITSWNLVGDAEFGSRIRTMVRTGDVICTTRGPKLKVAVAEFDCLSAHTNFIMRPKDCTTLLPTILEAIVRSDGFQEHLRKHFRGSTNLFVNWSDAAQYEFMLPPLEEQRQISRLLTHATELARSAQDVRDSLVRIRRSLLVDVFRPARGSCDSYPRHWTVVRAEAAGDCQLGQQRHPKFERGSNMRPYLRVANVLDGIIDHTDVLAMHIPEKDLAKFELRPGDILLNEGQSTELVGRSAIWRGEVQGMCFQKSLIRFRCGPRLLPEFAHAFFQHMLYTGQFARIAVQTTSMAHLTAVRFMQIPIPVPSLTEQEAIVDRIEAATNAAKSAVDRSGIAAMLHKRVINLSVVP